MKGSEGDEEFFLLKTKKTKQLRAIKKKQTHRPKLTDSNSKSDFKAEDRTGMNCLGKT